MPRVKRAVVNNNAPFISAVIDTLAAEAANNILNGGQQHPNLGQQQLHNNDHQAAFDAGEEAAAAAMEA
jgi:hypothetical protein